jgi:hypothetical protein
MPVRATLDIVNSPDDEPDGADCGAPEEFVDLERRLVTDPAVKAWRLDPETPDVIDVQMRRLSAAGAP